MPELNTETLQADPGAGLVIVGRRLAAIGRTHRYAELQSLQARERATAVLKVMDGIRHSHGVAPIRNQVADTDILRDILRAIEGPDLRSVRDRAALVVGVAGAFHRSELVVLRWSDPERVPEGLRLIIRRSKTDQKGGGQGAL